MSTDSTSQEQALDEPAAADGPLSSSGPEI
jgi:hypothetical protein